MIIVKLKGGLGNQLFQYAIGRRIAWNKKVPLKLDLSWFENIGNDTSRKYELNHFKIIEEFASREEIKKVIKDTFFYKAFRRFGKRFFPTKWNSHVTEKKISFDPNIILLQDNVYLDGVWGNEKYFSDIEDIIRQEFQLRDSSDKENMKIAERIVSSNSISIHVRRGDYVSNPITNKYHGLCSLEYYESSINEIVKRIKEPHFFVFSDDSQWVKNNLAIGYPTTYISYNSPDQGYEDLNLMSKCKHNIIANSSFSWWGAWLNSNPHKIIYAPAKWSNSPSVNSKDFLPEKWITI